MGRAVGHRALPELVCRRPVYTPLGWAPWAVVVIDVVGSALPPFLRRLTLLEEEQGSRPGDSGLHPLFRLQKMVTERALPLQAQLIFDLPG